MKVLLYLVSFLTFSEMLSLDIKGIAIGGGALWGGGRNGLSRRHFVTHMIGIRIFLIFFCKFFVIVRILTFVDSQSNEVRPVPDQSDSTISAKIVKKRSIGAL